MKKSLILLTILITTITFTSCGSSTNSICNSIKPISSDLSASLQKISADFGSNYNSELATSLAELRKFNSNDPAISEPLNLLTSSIESLMSNLNSGNQSEAVNNVSQMTTSIQSLIAVCNK